jgi:hypothetical protein
MAHALSPEAQFARHLNVVSHSVPVSQAVCSAQQFVATQVLQSGIWKSWPVAAQPVPPPAPVVFEPVVFEPVVFEPVVFEPVVFEPVVFEPVVFVPVVPVPPVPPVSPVVVPVAGLLPHAATANIETTIAPNAQDFMLMPPTTRDVRSWSPPD